MVLKQLREIVEADRHIGMIRAVALFVDRERAAHQRLGLGEAVRVLKQPREIVEADRHIGMIWAIALLVDHERAAHQRLGLGEAVCVLKQLREIAEADRDHRDDWGRSSFRRSRARGA